MRESESELLWVVGKNGRLKLMSVLGVRVTTFNDAYWFSTQAKSLPDVPSAQSMRDVYVRASILMSWVALEAIVKWCEGPYVQQLSQPRPKELRRRAKELMVCIGNSSQLNEAKYKHYRQIRNDIAHARSTPNLVTYKPEVAQESFDFCFNLGKEFLPLIL